jgi:S1-C subfamily serine protease
MTRRPPRVRFPRAASFGLPKGHLLGSLNKHRQAGVNITAIGVQRDLFTLNLYQIPQGTGSGFVWDTKGNIITNFHVIQNADAAQVTLGDHEVF